MNALVIGAGSVGQVYAYFLQRGGASVSVFVKPKHAAHCRTGFDLYPLNQKQRRHTPLHFDVSGVYTTLSEVSARSWDIVFLCIPTTGLHGNWIEDLIPAVKGATIVNLIPGTHAQEELLKFIPSNQLVSGVITLISYPAPLANETVPKPGTAFWFPPFSSAPLSGPTERVKPLVALLRAGGFKSHLQAGGIQNHIGFPDSLLTVFIAALRHSEWSFKHLADSKAIEHFLNAVREVIPIVAHRIGRRPPLALALLNPTILRGILKTAPHLFPFHLETLLKTHFTKVDEQMKELLSSYIEDGLKFDLPVQALQKLK